MRSTRILSALVAAILSCGWLGTSAQSLQQQKTDSVFQLVKKNLDAQQADSLYALTGNEFQQYIDREKFGNFVSEQLFPLGPIKQFSLASFVNNKIATYKLAFNAASLQLLISLDDSCKINYMQFIPDKKQVNKPALVASSNPLRSAMDKKIDTLARVYIQKANTVGLSIGVFKNGVISVYNYGETTRGNGKLPTANTIFEIGSITKTFTATLLAYYVDEGKVKLTDPITKYLPDSVAANPALQNITLLNLSNHTSGLQSIPDNLVKQADFDQLNPYKNYTKPLLFAYLKSCTLSSPPGKQYSYSNLGVGLLGIILEQVSGKTYSQMVAEIITTPLCMNSTAAYLTPLQKEHFVSVYTEGGDNTLPWDFDALAPAGILKSTVNNLLIYARANMVKSGTKLSKAFELTHQVTFNKDIQLGLNWIIIKVNGVEYYFHDGGTYGSSSFLAFNAEKKVAVVVLSNCAESTLALGAGLLDH